MRFSLCVIPVLGALFVSAPAQAQTYDPHYPVCMHTYGSILGDRIDCNFMSLAQCAASASGLPAMCIVNPYYAAQPPRRSRRH